MVYTPLGNRVLIKTLPATEEETKIGSLHLHDSAIILEKAVVMSVGKGDYAPSTGELIPTSVKKDDTVLVRKELPYLPVRLPNDEIEYKLCRESDIEAIIEL